MVLLTSLRAKFIVATILILVGAIGLSSWWSLRVQRDQLVAETREKVSLLAGLVEKSLVHEMLEREPQHVHELLHEAGHYSDIYRLWVLDEDGRITFSSKPGEAGRTVPPERLARYLDAARKGDAVMIEEEEDGHPIQALVKPIRNRPECHQCHDPSREFNGILHVDFSLARMQGQIAFVHLFALSSAALTIVSLAVALSVLLGRLVNRPVSALIRTMSRAEKGDLDARVPVAASDELGRLGESFNYMIGSLREAKRQLEAEHQRQLEQAEKMATLGQLASAVAHEVKNPLAGVSGAIQVLARDYPPDDPKRKVMEEVLDQIRRLDRTVNDLLSYARPTLPEPVPCDLNDVVRRVVSLVRQQVEGSQVSIVTDCAEGLPQVHVDPQQMQQVILNIALNGVQAMPGAGTLTVRTRALGAPATAGANGTVEVAVSDTGRGIPPEDRKRIFQPFFTTRHRGTGLGLSICQRIVDQHGGALSIESEVGRGTTVTVRLPAGPSG